MTEGSACSRGLLGCVELSGIRGRIQEVPPTTTSISLIPAFRPLWVLFFVGGAAASPAGSALVFLPVGLGLAEQLALLPGLAMNALQVCGKFRPWAIANTHPRTH